MQAGGHGAARVGLEPVPGAAVEHPARCERAAPPGVVPGAAVEHPAGRHGAGRAEIVHGAVALVQAGGHGAPLDGVKPVPDAGDQLPARIALSGWRYVIFTFVRFLPMIAQALSKPVANVNVTAYTGNAATGRILPAIIFGRGIRSKAEALIVTASVPILGSPDAPAARKKARVGKVVLEPVNVCINTGLIPRCRNLTAEGLCDRCELRRIVERCPLGRTIGICFLLFQVIVNGKGG